MDRSPGRAYRKFTLMKTFPTTAVSSRRLALVLLSALVLVVLTARGVSFAPELAHAAPPAITVNEVDQSPSTSVGSVALGSTITYTVHITLSAGQAAGMSIALRGNANIGPAGRTVTCSAPAGNNVPNQSTGTPSCGWPGPVTSGAYTLTFFGPVNGPIDDAVPFASSRVCSDTNNNNSCSDEAAGDIVDLLDASGDVGPLTIIGSAPAAPVLSVNEVSASRWGT